MKLHSHKRMVGTRKVLREDDEVQPNGKVFKKWEMGEYEWKSYMQIDEMANNFGKGLRELGLNPMDRICIFAETKADWLVCALGCFKQTFPLVTLYANLGDDAIVHGVNETEVNGLFKKERNFKEKKFISSKGHSCHHHARIDAQVQKCIGANKYRQTFDLFRRSD